MTNLRRKQDTSLRHYLRARANDPHSEMIMKILHALDTNKNDVCRELRYLGLLPQQCEELHGIELDALNSHFASVSTTDASVSYEGNEDISQASENGFRFSAEDANEMFWQWPVF